MTAEPEIKNHRNHPHAPCRVVPEAVMIPSGTFRMGAGSDDSCATPEESPSHLVEIRRPFLMGRHPVTVGEFRHFRPDHAPDDHVELPAVGMSWWEAAEYCAWLTDRTGESWRLPTEAEWEYACRAGTTSRYHSGEELSLEDANYLYTNDGSRIGSGMRVSVGSFPENPWGLCCMHGNVAEWVADLWHPSFEGAPTDGSAWIEQAVFGRRVIRGGAWDQMPRQQRSSSRDHMDEHRWRDNVGFRVVLTMPD